MLQSKIQNRKSKTACLAIFSIGCALLSACEPLPISVTIKRKAGADAATADAGPQAGPAGYGTLTGTITYTGNVAARPPLVAKGDAGARDASVCAAEPVPDESLVVNAENKGLANAIIFLAKAPANIKEELKAPPEEPAEFDQKGCRFFPHVVVVRVGQKLLIKSGDSIAHNTHTFPSRNDVFNSTIAANDRQGVPTTYKKPENSPVEVKCDLHTWMKAYHFPVDHPYVAKTDENGKFTIEGLPAGKHVFKVWQERGGFLEAKLTVEIKPDGTTTQDLSYGADRIAGVATPAKTVTIARLQQGGEVTFEE
jgi:hypothetical protein